MGNEDSKLIDDGNGEYDPRKNYDKRTSRKHHKRDFEAAITSWKFRHGGKKKSPRRRRRSSKSPPPIEGIEALGLAADMPPPPPPGSPSSPPKSSPNSLARKRADQLAQLKRRNRKRNVSHDSQPPPPPPVFPPPAAGAAAGETETNSVQFGEEEKYILGWFQNLCLFDSPRALTMLNALEKIHANMESGESFPAPDSVRSNCSRKSNHSWDRRLSVDSAFGESKKEDRRVSVFVRKRPMFQEEKQTDFDVVDASGLLHRNSIVVFDTRMKADMRRMQLTPNVYEFDRVFNESVTNEFVFQCTALDLVEHAMDGNLASAFMFGQTGSGKTFTMSALILQSGREIYQRLAQLAATGTTKTSVTISMFELYGTKCRDLLGQMSSTGPQSPSASLRVDQDEKKEEKDSEVSSQPDLLRLFDDHDGSLRIDGLTEKDCCSEEMFVLEFKRGQEQRATSETGVHDRSSRSHAFYKVRIQVGAKVGELLLVDLAGSERNKDSMKHSAKLQKEAAEINSSLSALKDCFRAQATNQPFVPFRRSMLTRLLKQSLEEQTAKTTIIATVSPSSGDTEHTLSTLGNVSMMLSESEASLRHKKMDSVEVKSLASIAADKAYEEAKQADPKRWSTERVEEWWRQNAPPKVEPPSNVTGAMLSKWPKARFIQHCTDALKPSTAVNGTNGSVSSPSPSPRPFPSQSPKKPSGGVSTPVPNSPSKGVRSGELLYEAFRGEISKLRKRQEMRAQMKRG